MESPATRGLWSLQEYFELGKGSAAGASTWAFIYATTGFSRRHSRIAGNIFATLRQAARGTPCRTCIGDMKVLTPDELCYYPDVMVACDPEPGDPYLEDGPCLIVEVVSPNTESTDRREKLLAHRNIPTLGAHLIVDHERQRVERHFRDDAGVWQRADLVERGSIPLPCPPGAELALTGIYEGL